MMKWTLSLKSLSLHRFIWASVTCASLMSISACSEKQNGAVDIGAQVTELEALRAEVARLKDRQRIDDLYMRYMRGFDRNDRELLESAFWPDVQIGYGDKTASLGEFITTHLDYHVKEYGSYSHLITNKSVDISGDVAHVEIYVTGFFSRKNNRTAIGGGRYIDRLDRRNGEWRIAVREFIPTFWTETDSSIDSYFKQWPRNDCWKGTSDKRDLSYVRPLNARREKGVSRPCDNAAAPTPR